MKTENGFVTTYGALRFVLDLKGYNPKNPGETDYAYVQYIDNKGKYGRSGKVYESSAFLTYNLGLVGMGEEVELTDNQRAWVEAQMGRMNKILNERFPEPVPAAACPRCGGWTESGGMSQYAKSTVPVMGRKGCTC